MEEDRFMHSMLLDFYGELLTDKQRQCYDLHYNEDLSLAEIAEQSGISRQGVWDNIRRAESALTEYEQKTGLISRFREMRQALRLSRKALTAESIGNNEAAKVALAAIDAVLTGE